LKKTRAAFFVVLLFLLSFAGSCDRTILKGTILPEKDRIKVNETVKLELKVPPELDRIYRVYWTLQPKESGEIKYKNYDDEIGPFLKPEEYGKEDRTAYLVAKKPGKCEIRAYGFFKQTNPQYIATLFLEISE